MLSKAMLLLLISAISFLAVSIPLLTHFEPRSDAEKSRNWFASYDIDKATFCPPNMT